MLEPVIQNVRPHVEKLFRRLPAPKAIGANYGGDPGKRAGEEGRFITYFLRVDAVAFPGRQHHHLRPASAAISARENAGTPAPARQHAGDVHHQRCLAGPPHSQVAHAHHRLSQAPSFKPPAPIGGVSHRHAESKPGR